MTRFSLQAVLMTAIVVVLLAPCAQAQYPANPYQRVQARPRVMRRVYYAQPQPKRIVIDPNQRTGAPLPQTVNRVQVGAVPQQAGYVRLNAPLYPSPRPNIPYQVGAVMITNQAFAPHEMLYPHTYRAVYPPYYYRVRGRWFGILGQSHAEDNWELQGTEVEVQYRSRLPFMSRFSDPFKIRD